MMRDPHEMIQDAMDMAAVDGSMAGPIFIRTISETVSYMIEAKNDS